MNQEANQVTRQASAPRAGLETELRDAAPALAAALDPTAPVLDPREARRRAMDARCPLKRLVRSLAALLATAAVLVACGTPPAPQGDAELACVQEGYACRLADVDPAVLARSIALGDLAQQMFLDGDDAEQVAESLAAEDDVVYLAVGDGGLVFRVEGGTPVVVNPSVDQVPDDPTAGPLSVATPPGVDPERYAAYVSGWDSATPAGPGLVAGGDGPKSAIVMSMYQYEAGELDSSGYVAGILNSHSDYSGRVDYLYSNPLADEWVSVRDMLGLDEYELVYMVTHGGAWASRRRSRPGRGTAPASSRPPRRPVRATAAPTSSSTPTKGSRWATTPSSTWAWSCTSATGPGPWPSPATSSSTTTRTGWPTRCSCSSPATRSGPTSPRPSRAAAGACS